MSNDVKHILIGGAEGFLGRHAVQFFAQRNLKVTGACRTEQDLERMQEFIKKGGLSGVQLVTADLGDQRAITNLVTTAESKFGPVDAMFNAAGAFRYGATVDASLADYDLLITANFKSSFLLAQAVVKGMMARGFGRLVFVSSKATLGPGEANMALYGASKSALNALVTSLAAEVKKNGVTVNAIMPSMIDTPANRESMPKADFNDWVTTDALLSIVAMLLGPTGSPINGALIPVPGRL